MTAGDCRSLQPISCSSRPCTCQGLSKEFNHAHNSMYISDGFGCICLQAANSVCSIGDVSCRELTCVGVHEASGNRCMCCSSLQVTRNANSGKDQGKGSPSYIINVQIAMHVILCAHR